MHSYTRCLVSLFLAFLFANFLRGETIVIAAAAAINETQTLVVVDIERPRGHIGGTLDQSIAIGRVLLTTDGCRNVKREKF